MHANAALGIRVKSLLGGHSFLFKMIPARGMSASFLYDQVNEVLLMIQNVGGQPVSVSVREIIDGKFFKKFETITSKLCLTTG